MIHIEKDQKIFDSDHLQVATPTGDYEDLAMIEFYDINNPSVIPGTYEAQYVVYGNLVYQFNDPTSLGEAILAVDPKSTHTAASYVRMTRDLLAQMNAGKLESNSLDQAIATEQANTDAVMASSTEESLAPTDIIPDEASTTPESVAPVFEASVPTASSTDAIPSPVSSTTETSVLTPDIEPLLDDVSTTTPTTVASTTPQ